MSKISAAAFFVAALIAVHANVEVGMNDDWSFVRTVHDLAAGGHLQYNGWSAPLIGFQAYWGALFAKIFGFSFLAVRASSWVITLAAIPVLWRLLRATELSQRQAFAGLIGFLFSPLVLPNLAAFMTDMPAFFLFAAALLTALKAWKASTERGAAWWLCATTGLAMLSGSVRQIYWLAGICFVVTVAIVRLRSIGGRAAAALLVVVTGAFGAACSHWLAQQPYVPFDTTSEAWRQLPWRSLSSYSAKDLIRDLIGLAVVAIPFTLPVAWAERRRYAWWLYPIIAACSLYVSYRVSANMPWLGNTITSYGVTMTGTLSLGDKPEILSMDLMLAIATIGLTSGILALGSVRQMSRIAILTTPFLLLYLAVLAIRAPAFGLYDRYMIPLLFCIIAAAKWTGRSSWIGAALVGIYAIYALATTHDYFAEARAKLEAVDILRARGVARNEILSGFEYDLWTQTEQAGHVNNKLLKFPANAYQQKEDCNGADETQAWWRSMAPVLKARYAVSLTRLSSMREAMPPFEYRRWLPFGENYVYVGETDTPLTCKAARGD